MAKAPSPTRGTAGRGRGPAGDRPRGTLPRRRRARRGRRAGRGGRGPPRAGRRRARRGRGPRRRASPGPGPPPAAGKGGRRRGRHRRRRRRRPTPTPARRTSRRRRLGREAQPGNVRRHHGRRHRLVEHQHLQQRHDGLRDAEHRSHRQGRRDVHRLVRAAELHGRPRRVHHGPVADPHRPDQGRPARAPTSASAPRTRRSPSSSSRSATHRAVRQEPPGRPGRVAADRPRLRRVLRQPLSPERRRGAGESGLPEGPRVQEEDSARAAC